MNKVVLSIFVVLAIGMAELPSIFGCGIIYGGYGDNGERGPRGQGREFPGPNPSPYRSVDAVDNVFELELEGFSICDTDGTEGLTFNEINACQVNCNFTHDT